MYPNILTRMFRATRRFRWTLFFILLMAAAGNAHAQRQQGHVGGRYYGWDVARPLHTQAPPHPITSVNTNQASNGLMINPGTIEQVEPPTATQGALFELKGFSIGSGSNYYNELVGSLFYGRTAANAAQWRRMVNFDRDLPAVAGQSNANNTYNLAEGMVWLIVNWGNGANTRIEMKLNNKWQLVPRWPVFFRYEINQNPPCEYIFRHLQVQLYYCNGSPNGNSANNGACNGTSVMSGLLFNKDLTACGTNAGGGFYGMPCEVTVPNPQADTEVSFQTSPSDATTLYEVCVGDRNWRRFMDYTRYKCDDYRYIQFEYRYSNGQGGTAREMDISANQNAVIDRIGIGEVRRDGGPQSGQAPVRRSRYLSGARGDTYTNYVRLPANAVNGDQIIITRYLWNTSNLPANTANPTDADRQRASQQTVTINVVAATDVADPYQDFDYCYPNNGYSNNNYTTQIKFNGQTTLPPGVTMRVYGSNAAGTAPEGTRLPGVNGTTFNPVNANIPDAYRLKERGNTLERNRTYWVTTYKGNCESTPVKITFRVREDISTGPGIRAGSATACAGGIVRYHVADYHAELPANGGDPISYRWMPGTGLGYRIVATADGNGETGKWADIEILNNGDNTPRTIKMYRYWTDPVSNTPTGCPTRPDGEAFCNTCFSKISETTTGITLPPTGTLTGAGIICGTENGRQLTINNLQGGTGQYTVKVTGPNYEEIFPNIKSPYTFTVNPPEGQISTYALAEISADEGNACINTNTGQSVEVTRRQTLSLTGATLTTPDPLCEQAQFSAILSGVNTDAINDHTEFVWTYDGRTQTQVVPKPAGSNITAPSFSAGGAGAGKTMSVRWRYADGLSCDTEKPYPLTVTQGPKATSASPATQTICQGQGASVEVTLEGGTDGQPYTVEWHLEGPSPSGTQSSGGFTTSPATIAIDPELLGATNGKTGPYTFFVDKVERAGSCAGVSFDVTPITIKVEKKPIATFPAPANRTQCEWLPVTVNLTLTGEPNLAYVVEYRIGGGAPQLLTINPPPGDTYVQPITVDGSYITYTAPNHQVLVEILSVRQEGGQSCATDYTAAPITYTINVEQIEEAVIDRSATETMLCHNDWSNPATLPKILNLKGVKPSNNYESGWLISENNTYASLSPLDPTQPENRSISSSRPGTNIVRWTIWKTGNPGCYSRDSVSVIFGQSGTQATVYEPENDHCYNITTKPRYTLLAHPYAHTETGLWEVWKIQKPDKTVVWDAEQTPGVNFKTTPPGTVTPPGNWGTFTNETKERAYVTPEEYGIYTFRWVVTGGCGFEVDTTIVTFIESPEMKPVKTPGKDNYLALCDGQIIDPALLSFDATPAVSPVTGFRWKFDPTYMDGFIPSSTGHYLGQFPAGRTARKHNNNFSVEIYYIEVEATDGTCYSDPMQIQIDVKPTPPAVKLSSTAVCAGAEVMMSLDGNMWQDTEYSWTTTDETLKVIDATYTAGAVNGADSKYAADATPPPFSFLFKTKNPGNTPIAANFTVKAAVNGCAGPVSYPTLTVNPTPVLSLPAPTPHIIAECPATIIKADRTTIASTVGYTEYTWVWNGNAIGATLPTVVTGQTYTYNNALTEFAMADNISTSRLGGTMTVTGSKYGCKSTPVSFEMWVSPRPDVSLPVTQTLCPAADGSGGTFNPFTLRSSNLTDGQATYNWEVTNPDGTFRVSGTDAQPKENDRKYADNTSGGIETYTWKVTATGNNKGPAVGCPSPEHTFVMNVYPRPVITITNNNVNDPDGTGPLPDIGICSGEKVFDNIIFGTGTVNSQFTWSIEQPPMVSGGVITTGATAMWGQGSQVTFSSLPLHTAPVQTGITDTYTSTVRVNATSQNGCPSGEQTTTLKIRQKPVVSTPAAIELCSGAPSTGFKQGTDNSVTPVKYYWRITDENLWDKGPGTLEGTPGTSTAFSAGINSGTTKRTANLELWADHANGCVSDKATFPLTVYPQLKLTTPTDLIVVCPGELITLPAFTSNVYGNDASMISWTYHNVSGGDISSDGRFTSGGPGFLSSGNINSFFAAGNNTGNQIIGEFNITVGMHWSETLTTCTSGAAKTLRVKVNSRPDAPALPTGVTSPIAYCHGESVRIIGDNGSLPAGDYQYLFDNSGGRDFIWENTRDIALTGGDASGSGTLQFVAENNTQQRLSERVTTFLVREETEFDGKVCPSENTEFEILVRSVPQLAEDYVTGITQCNGTKFEIPKFGLHVRFNASDYDYLNDTKAVYDWEFTGDLTGIGLTTAIPVPATVSGNTNPVPEFTPTGITGANPRNLMLTVTPSYDVSYTGRACAGDPKMVSIVINPSPEATFADQTVCSGLSFKPIDFGVQPANATYTWEITPAAGQNGNLGAAKLKGTDESVVFNTPTEYTVPATGQGATHTAGVTVTMTSADKCVGTATKTLTILQAPVMTPIKDLDVCNGEKRIITVEMSDPAIGAKYGHFKAVKAGHLLMSGGGYNYESWLTTNPGKKTYNWDTKMTNSTTQSQSGDVYVRSSFYHGNRECHSAPDTFKVTVRPTPRFGAIADPAAVCSGEQLDTANLRVALDRAMDFKYELTFPTGQATIIGAPVNGTDPAFPTTGNRADLKTLVKYYAAENIAAAGTAGANLTGKFTLTAYMEYTSAVDGKTIFQCGADKTQSFTATVKPKPAKPAIADPDLSLTYCHNENVPQITFESSTGATFTWSIPAGASNIGLPTPSGGSIPVFRIQNNTTDGLNYDRANVSVQAGLNGCVNPDMLTFPITVKPIPQMKPYGNIAVCSGTEATPAAFALVANLGAGGAGKPATPAMGGFKWQIAGNWFAASDLPNPNVSPAYRAGNLPAFTPVSTVPVVMNLTVIPEYDGCEGDPVTTATITVNPAPVVNSFTDQRVCSGTSFTQIDFDVQPAGSTFKWTITPNPDDPDHTTGASSLTGTTGESVLFPKPAKYIPATGENVTFSSEINLTMESPNGCKATATPRKLTVYRAPEMTPIPDIDNCVDASYTVPLSIKEFPAGATLTSFYYNAGKNTLWDKPVPSGIILASRPHEIEFHTKNTFSRSDSTDISVYALIAYPAAVGGYLRCYSDTAEFELKVRPVPQFSAIMSPDPVCPGGTVAIPALNNSVDSKAKINWTLNNVNIAKPVYPGTGDRSNLNNFTAADNTAPANGAGTNLTGTFTLTAYMEYKRENNGTMFNCFAGGNAKPLEREFTVTVRSNPATPVIVDPTNLLPDPPMFCHNASVPAINFASSTGATFAWSINAGSDDINLPPAQGNYIPGFSIRNNTASQLGYGTANITVKATLNGCTNTAALPVEITVKPFPQMKAYADIALCSGATHTPAAFELLSGIGTNKPGAPATGDFEWRISNNWFAASDLPDPGTATAPVYRKGNLKGVAYPPAFTPVSDAPVVMNLTVIPEYDGCKGDAQTSYIRIHPLPTVTVANPTQTICAGETFDAVRYSTSISGSSVAWALALPAVQPGFSDNTGIALTGTGGVLPAGDITFDNPSAYINQNTYTATFSITATAPNAGTMTTGCVSKEPATVTLNVLKTPVLKDLTDMEDCAGVPQNVILNVKNGTPILGYRWKIANTDLTVDGSGNTLIPTDISTSNNVDYAVPFTTRNTTNLSQSAKIEFWAVSDKYAAYGNKQCVSAVEDFTLTVRPIPSIGIDMPAVTTECPNVEIEVPGFTTNILPATGTPSVEWKWSLTNNVFAPALTSPGTGNIGTLTTANTANTAVSGIFKVWAEMDYERTKPDGSKEPYTCATPNNDRKEFTVTVKPKPTLTPIDDPAAVCDNTWIDPFELKSDVANTTFKWESTDFANVGWVTSGSGTLVSSGVNNTAQIAGFTAFNGMTADDRLVEGKATVKVTATAAGCPGTSDVFTITVKPVPQLTPGYSVPAVCSGGKVEPTAFALHPKVAGYGGASATTSYAWALAGNTNVTVTPASMSLPATGNLTASPYTMPVFTPTIASGAADQSLTLTVTPTHAGCPGVAKNVTISISQLPDIIIANKPTAAICSGDNFGTITLSSASGAGFTWFLPAPPATGLLPAGAGISTGVSNATLNGTLLEGTGNSITFGKAFHTANLTSWNGGSGTDPYTATVTIRATAQGALACKNDSSFTLSVKQAPIAKVPADLTACSETSYPNTAFPFGVTNNAPVSGYNWRINGEKVWDMTQTSGNGVTALPAFTTVKNTAATNAAATVTVTAVHTNGCSSEAETFDISVRPLLTVNPINPAVVCPGITIPGHPLSANITTDTRVAWKYTDATPGIVDPSTPIASSGSGNTPTFKVVNGGNTLLTGIFALTASYTDGGPVCDSKPNNFMVTVNPRPAITTPTADTVCHNTDVGTDTKPFLLISNVANTIFNWTTNNTHVNTGWATSGSGTAVRVDDYTARIGGYKALNGMTADEQLIAGVTTITVTPDYEGCAGTEQTFTIMVKPVPQLIFPDNDVLKDDCSDTEFTGIPAFKLRPEIVHRGTTTYDWYVSSGWVANTAAAPNTPIADGVHYGGNIGAFTPSLPATVLSPHYMTVTATPTHDGCEGIAKDLRIRIKPRPVTTVTVPDTVCSDVRFAKDISFTTNLNGTSTFEWYFDPLPGAPSDVSPGLAATPASFTAVGSSVPFIDAPHNTTNGPHYTANFYVRATVNGCAELNPKIQALTIRQAPVMTEIDDMAVCSGIRINEPDPAGGYKGQFIPFTVTDPANMPLWNGGAAYSWSVNNPGIGETADRLELGETLVAAMKQFTTYNSGTTDNLGMVTVRARHENGCYSAPETFTLRVMRAPVMTPVALQEACPDTEVKLPAFNYTAYNAHPVTVHWALDNTGILKDATNPGLSGNLTATQSYRIDPFRTNPVVTGSAVEGIFSVNARMYYDPADNTKYCNGPATDVVVRVNPTPAAPTLVAPAAPVKYDFCAEETVPSYEFGSTTAGVTFRWTATGDNIGLSSVAATGNIPGFEAENNTPQQIGTGTANITVTAVSAQGCPGKDDQNLKFTLKVKPVPQILPYKAIEVCAGTEHPSERFILNPKLVAAYASADSSFSWSISGNIPQSGLPDNSPAVPPGYGYLPDFTPDISLAQGQKKEDHPLWGNNATYMTMTVTPHYAGCPGIPVPVPVTLKPKPITNITTAANTCAPAEGEFIIYQANKAQNPYNSEFTWTLVPDAGHPMPELMDNNKQPALMVRFNKPDGTVIELDDMWTAKLSVTERNRFGCSTVNDTAIKVIPRPVVSVAGVLSMCSGSALQITNVTLESPKTYVSPDMVYNWSPPQYIRPQDNSGGSELTLTPWVYPFTTGTVTIDVTPNDRYNGCSGDPTPVTIEVVQSPVAPAVAGAVYCESDALMKMNISQATITSGTVGSDVHLYWERLEPTATPGTYAKVSIQESADSTHLSMKRNDLHNNALPRYPLKWGAATVDTTILYQVYQTKTLNTLTCVSPASRTELKINRTPAAPESKLFAYCVMPGNPMYALNTRTIGTSAVAVNWYNPAGVHLGSGNNITVNQPGESSAAAPGAAYTHEPFYYLARTTSAANCLSDAARIPLIVYPNPDMTFALTDKAGDPLAEGCSPLAVYAENQSATIGAAYRWTWAPGESEDAPIGFNDRKDHTYRAAGTASVPAIVQLNGSKQYGEPDGTRTLCSLTESKTLVIYPGVEASFVVSDTVGCDALPVMFTNTSQGAYRSRWYWNTPTPPANAAVPSANPSDPLYGTVASGMVHTFENKNSGVPKHYRVWLQVDNDKCFDNRDTVITVYPVPNASFDHNLTAASICPPLPVVFTNTSEGTSYPANDSHTRYIWDFADGQLDTLRMTRDGFEHYYENRVLSVPLPQMVQVTAFNRYRIGGADSLTCYSLPARRQILVNPQVEALFTGPENICSPLPATFRSQSTGSLNSSSFLWNFGDGSPAATGSNPTHTFVNNSHDKKEHTITLTVKNNWCSDDVSKTFTSLPQPVASFRAEKLADCHPFRAVFTNTSGNDPQAQMTYTWDFADGSPAGVDNAATVAHTYNNVSGADMNVYPVLTAHNEWGCAGVPFNMTQITVFPYLNASFEMEDSIGCSPLTVRFRNGSQGYTSYMYQFGNSGGATGNIESGIMNTHTFKADNTYRDKTYDVRLTVRRGSCVSEITKQVLVYSQPEADFRPKAPYPADYLYPVSSVGVENLVRMPDAEHLTYLWSWTDLQTEKTTEFSNIPNPSPFGIDDWGEFSVTQQVTAPNGKCSDRRTVFFNIVPPPAEAVFDEVSPACVPYEVQFVNNTKYAKAFRWDFGDENTSGEENPKHTFMKPGTFTVTLTARGYNMAEQTFSREITVHPTPQAGFEVYPNFRWVGQPVETANYTTHETDDGQQYDVWYRWNWGDGSAESIDKDPMHMYLKAGVYNVTLTAGTFTGPQCVSVATKTGAITLESAGDIILPNTFKPDPSIEQPDVIPALGYKNYLFYPPVLSPTRRYSMKIFNRWGIQIYETDDANRGWNGYFKGRICDEGTYTYKIEGVFETGQSFSKVGTVTILR